MAGNPLELMLPNHLGNREAATLTASGTVRTHEIGQSAGKGAKLVMTEQAPPSETARFSSASDGCRPEAL